MDNEFENDFNKKSERKFNIRKITTTLKLFVSPKIKANDVNIKLEEMGFQHKDEKGNWVVNGNLDSEYFEERPFESKYSNYTGTRILWTAKTLDLLIDEFFKDYKEDIKNDRE